MKRVIVLTGCLAVAVLAGGGCSSAWIERHDRAAWDELGGAGAYDRFHPLGKSAIGCCPAPARRGPAPA